MENVFSNDIEMYQKASVLCARFTATQTREQHAPALRSVDKLIAIKGVYEEHLDVCDTILGRRDPLLHAGLLYMDDVIAGFRE